MIVGGLTLADQSRRAIKLLYIAIASCYHWPKNLFQDSGVPQVPHHLISIYFMKKDVKGISYPYDDALVITLKVATGKVTRMLVDTNSSANIIFKSALDQLLTLKIYSNDTLLISLAGHIVILKASLPCP